MPENIAIPIFKRCSRKCPETSNLTIFTMSKWCQKGGNQQTVIKIESVLKVVRILQAILSVYIVREMPGNPKFDPFHWVKIASNQENQQTVAIILSVLDTWWPGYINMLNIRPFLTCFSREMRGNCKLDPFRKVKIRPKLGKSTAKFQTIPLMHFSEKPGKLRTDEGTDGQKKLPGLAG